MAKSLQDQLLKAGLIDTNKAKKSKSDKRKQLQQQRKNKVEVIDENKLQIEQAKAEKLERDRKLNLKLKQQADQKALVAQIKQLILMNRQEMGDNGEAYNFVDQRSEEHTSELRHVVISYAVFCVKKNKHLNSSDVVRCKN